MSVTSNIKQIPNHPRSVQKGKRKLADVRLIVIHTMESPETAQTAENVASWLSRGGPGSPAGVHFCVDRDSIVQMAELVDVTAGAAGRFPNGKSANRAAVHIELAGRAGQNPAQWADAASKATLANAAALCREILLPKLGIPLRHLTVAQLRAGQKGFCGHIDITNACNVRNGHWDPGPDFPWQQFLAQIGADAREEDIRVFVAGKEVQGALAYQDAAGSVWVRLRVVIDQLPEWSIKKTDPPRAILQHGGVEVPVPFKINAEGTGFSPVSALCDVLGLAKGWDKDTRQVFIG